MKTILLQTRFKLLELFRQPAYVAGTLLFPSLFFLFFALPNADDEFKANLLMGSFAAYAFLGVVFFQFGVDISSEKDNKWFHFQQTLPISNLQLFIARVLAALVFSFLACWTVVLVVLASSDAHITFLNLIKMTLCLLALSPPFAFLATCIGLLFRSRAALPFTNIVYLSMAFIGGMWIPPAGLPESIQKISVYFPTRLLAEVSWHYSIDFDLKASRFDYYFVFCAVSLLLMFLCNKLTEKNTRL